MTDAVLIVELRLRDGVVDVDSGEQKLALFEELIQAVNTGCGLLRNTLDVRGDFGELSGALREVFTKNLQNDLPLGGVTDCWLRNSASLLEFNTLVDEHGGIAAVIEDHVGAGVTEGTPVKNLLGAPPVLLQGFALPSKDRGSLGVFRSSTPHDDGCCRVVLGGENVATGPANISTESNESLDQHCGLHRHVQ